MEIRLKFKFGSLFSHVPSPLKTKCHLWQVFFSLFASWFLRCHRASPWHIDPSFCVSALHYPRIRTSPLPLKSLLRNRRQLPARKFAHYCHIGRASVWKERVTAMERGTLGGWGTGKLAEIVFKNTFLFVLHGHRVSFRRCRNICVTLLLSGTERLYFLHQPQNCPLLLFPSLEAPGWRMDCWKTISTLGRNTQILV